MVIYLAHILQVLCKFVDEACPEKKAFVNMIQLSRNTMTRRTEILNQDIVKSLKEAVEDFVFFSIAIDESTDLSDTAQLAIMIRGVNQNFTIIEDFLALSSMQGRTTGRDIYNHVIAVLEEYELPIEKLAGVATDGAPAMRGDDIGFQGLLLKSRQWDTTPLHYHCIIHQQNLAAQTLNIDHVMNVVVSTVNFIRSRALNHRQFKQLLDEVDSEYGDVTYYSKVRWLSRGAVLKRFWQLIDQIDQFTRNKGRIHEEFQDCQWLNDLAFLVDITQHLNLLNKQLQGKEQLISKLWQYVSSFKTKLAMFREQLEMGCFIHFATLSTRKDKEIDAEKYSQILGVLLDEFNSRFEQFERTNLINVFANPVGYDPAKAPAHLQLELIDCQADDQIRRQFIDKDLHTFYKDFFPKDTYPRLYRHALRMASLFGSTYLCEKLFSNMKFTKNKYPTSLTDEHLQGQLRLATSTTRPNLQRIIDSKQCQVSH